MLDDAWMGSVFVRVGRLKSELCSHSYLRQSYLTKHARAKGQAPLIVQGDKTYSYKACFNPYTLRINQLTHSLCLCLCHTYTRTHTHSLSLSTPLSLSLSLSVSLSLPLSSLALHTARGRNVEPVGQLPHPQRHPEGGPRGTVCPPQRHACGRRHGYSQGRRHLHCHRPSLPH